MSGAGGGIYNNGGNVTIQYCLIHDNTATGNGGGIYSTGPLTLKNSTIYDNSSTVDGGGLFPTDVTTVTNCTFTGNTADYGGAVRLFSNGVAFTFTNTTIAGNTASTGSGGIDLIWGILLIKNSVLADNNGGSGVEDFDKYSSSTLTDNGYNLVENAFNNAFGSGTENITGNQINLNLSSSLAINNDPNGTLTLKTSSGSVAINAGDAGTANNGVAIPTTDQRGASRNGTIDIGAYEYFADDGSLPVELSSFVAQSKSGVVSLSWTTSSEIENLGFTIERRALSSRAESRDKMWTTISSYKTNPELAGQGSTSRETLYAYTDKDVSVGEKYEYRLSDLDYQGKLTQHETITVIVRDNGSDTKPGTFKVLAVYPNPFNPSATLSYTLEQDMQVSITVLDLRGRTIRTMTNSHQLAGDYSFEWDGNSNQGLQMTSGIYFFNIQGPNFHQAIKMVKLD